MTSSSIRRSVVAVSVAGAAALIAAGCGQEFATPPAASQQVPPTSRTAALTQADVCADPTTNCNPTGAHGSLAPGYTGSGGHAGFDCKVCHYVGGRLAFQPGGPAFIPGGQPPSFDATAKTCSNIACHGVPSGTFSYYFPGNEVDADGYPIPELKTVTVYGNPGGTTPSWYSTGLGCGACHPNPPRNGTDGSDVWHSGNHANNQNVGPIQPNACELCHNVLVGNTLVPIAFSSGTGAGTVGVSINTNATARARHGNGIFDVTAAFRTQCYGCH